MRQTVARARLHKKKRPKEIGTFGAAPDLCGRVRTADAAPTLVDLVRCPCYAGLQPAATKGIGTAARRIAWAMLRRSWQAGLQLQRLLNALSQLHER